MKGRSATKLLRQVEAWHGHLARVQDVVFQSWQTCGLRPYELDDESVAGWPSSGTFCVKPENEGARAQMSSSRRPSMRGGAVEMRTARTILLGSMSAGTWARVRASHPSSTMRPVRVATRTGLNVECTKRSIPSDTEAFGGTPTPVG